MKNFGYIEKLKKTGISLVEKLEKNQVEIGQLLFIKKTRHLVTCIGALICLAFMGGYILKTHQFVKMTQPFASYGSMPEQLLEYTAGKNYNEYGFMKNLLLTDYSDSPDAQDHPYLYTHQPSFPAVLVGYLLKLDFSLLQVRTFFYALSILGICLFACFIFYLSNSIIATFIALVLFSFDHTGTIQWLPHFVHSFYYLNFFGSLFCYFLFMDNVKTRKYLSALFFILYVLFFSLGFLTNFISAFPTLCAILLIHFAINRRNRFSKRVLLASIISIVVIGALHFTRNGLVLGFEIAWKDFLYTISNRAIGWPSKVALEEFYKANKIVLWGVGNVNIGSVFQILYKSLILPCLDLFVMPLMLLILWVFRLSIWNKGIKKITLSFLIISISVYFWHILFLAQGGNYNFPMINKFFTVFFITWFWLYLFKIVKDNFSTLTREKAVILLVIGTVFFQATKSVFMEKRFHRWFMSNKNYDMKNVQAYVELSKIVNKSDLILTNIDSLVLSFFTKSYVVGGCSLTGLNSLDYKHCPSTFLSKESLDKLPKPKYLLISKQYIPGYTDCFAACVEKKKNHWSQKHKEVARGIKDTWVLYEINYSINSDQQTVATSNKL